MKCQHCNAPNPEGYFTCRDCNKRASAPKYTLNMIMRDTPMATAIRKDQIDFGSMSMDKHIERTNKRNEEERAKKIDKMIFGKHND